METHVEEKKDRGFTLVELLIVIVILGILATVTVFAVRGITTRGKEASCETDKKTLEVAVEAYWALNGSNPASEAVLVTAQLLKTESPNYVVTDGVITVQAGNANGCTATNTTVAT